MDDTDVLIKYCDETWQEMRHIEEQRATITNMSIIISSVIIGYIAQQKLEISLVPISILMVLLGIFGIVFTSKLYERHQFAQSRINQWTQQIDRLQPGAGLLELRRIADKEHTAQFPKMSKIRLNRLWIILHATIMLVGIVLTILILFINL